MRFFGQFAPDFDYFSELIARGALGRKNNRKVDKMTKKPTGAYPKLASVNTVLPITIGHQTVFHEK